MSAFNYWNCPKSYRVFSLGSLFYCAHEARQDLTQNSLNLLHYRGQLKELPNYVCTFCCGRSKLLAYYYGAVSMFIELFPL